MQIEESFVGGGGVVSGVTLPGLMLTTYNTIETQYISTIQALG